ncbi:MAG TPA: trypsin-like peptidase domain-containing protein [Thermoanaerobaculia bacterium]|nr:trypsin-like peptidase domain-containing protein [Thermoanaerobaculia bacterium]
MNRASSCFLILIVAALGGFSMACARAEREAAEPAVDVQATPAAQAAPRARPSRGVPVAPRPELADEEKATIALFERASPSVVFITSLATQQDAFSMNAQEIPQGSGSGFVWDKQGHIVTNFHVVAGGNAARVTLADGSDWEARAVGGAAEKDIAVLKIDAPANRLIPLPLGSSDDLRVGQTVLAIGNPFGLDQTLTTGVVSALGREIQSLAGIPIRDVIQTDAAINPGNSGGPLLDSAGRLIGINTAIYSPSGTYAGIGFAIPAHAVQWVVPDLIAYGRIRRPTLGIELSPEGIAERLGIEGAVISRVEPGTGAARAGLRGLSRDRFGRARLGDVIQSIDGQPVTSIGDIFEVLENRQPGQTVRVGILRGDRKQTVEVRLGGGEGGRRADG